MTDGERRTTERHYMVEQHGITHARVRPGHCASVVDVSAGGALIETERRLLPGTAVELYLGTTERSVMIRGRVLRCAVARLRASAIAYRGAVGFDRELAWFAGAASCGYAVPTAEMPRNWAAATGATHLPA